MGNGVFSPEKLEEIFKLDHPSGDRVISRESTWLEFKESFGWLSLGKYVKTMAAFANVKGGYIVFGIKNSPHLLLGLTGEKLKTFNEIDSEKLSNSLNEYFSPEIKWDITIYKFQEREYGLIYTYESHQKPVMCIKNEDNILQEGTIYYRYRGRSQRIKYPELRDIIDAKRQEEQRLWMKLLLAVAKIGVRDVGIFNFKNGITTAGNGASFMIDEAILSKLSFIKEGEFSEVKGKPTLKVIGELTGVPPIIASGKPHIIHQRGISLSNIVVDFLNFSKIGNPLDYIVQICSETSANLPIYYYISKTGKSQQEILDLISQQTSRCAGKKVLVERISNNVIHHKEYSITGTKAALERGKFLDAIGTETEINITSPDEVKRFCEAIIHQDKDSIRQKKDYIRQMLKTIFINHYEKVPSTHSSLIRSALCWVDEALYLENCFK